MNLEDRPFLRLSNPMLWGIGLTIGILGLMSWIMLLSVCDAEPLADGECAAKWKFLLAAPPNIVGDSLSGFAGVLAFVWIIVTVAMQAEQLRAQREELRLTRSELADQRLATQDMARSMAAQAALFEDEKLRRDQSHADSVAHALNARIAQLFASETLLDTECVLRNPSDQTGSSRRVAWFAEYPREFRERMQGSEAFRFAAKEMRRFTHELSLMRQGGLKVVSWKGVPGIFARAQTSISELESIRQSLSQAEQVRIDWDSLSLLKKLINDAQLSDDLQHVFREHPTP